MRIERENPAYPRQIVGSVAIASPDDVFRTAAAAQKAQRDWCEMAVAERGIAVAAAASAALSDASDIALLMSKEMGKLLPECAGEIRFALALCNDYVRRAERLLTDEERGAGAGRRIVRRAPYGVVGAIVPWNAPVILTMTKVVPALLSGNGIVVKPSPLAPLAVTALIDRLRSRLPPGLISVVNGGGEVGSALVEAPAVKKIAFTGGPTVARDVLSLAARRFLPCVMELGGNDALVVLDDLEITPQILERIVWATFLNAGQVCMAAKRLFVPKAQLEAFVSAYVEVARGLFRLGDPTMDGTTMGPLVTAAARERIATLARSSRNRGGTLITLLRPVAVRVPQEGYFHEPLLVTNIDDDAPLVAEEQFGPIVPVLGYRSEEELPLRINAGDGGLTASAWSGDEGRAWALLTRLRVGMGMVNAHNRSGMSLDLPFGGVGASGFGREYGDEGLLEYSFAQSIHAPAVTAGGAQYPTT